MIIFKTYQLIAAAIIIAIQIKNAQNIIHIAMFWSSTISFSNDHGVIFSTTIIVKV
jgi:hypothetical protein